jgi:hypothetical protein
MHASCMQHPVNSPPLTADDELCQSSGEPLSCPRAGNGSLGRERPEERGGGRGVRTLVEMTVKLAFDFVHVAASYVGHIVS